MKLTKRGEITDMLVFLITVFVMGIGLFILLFVIPNISSGLRVAGLNNSVEGERGVQAIDNLGGGYKQRVYDAFCWALCFYAYNFLFCANSSNILIHVYLLSDYHNPSIFLSWEYIPYNYR